MPEYWSYTVIDRKISSRSEVNDAGSSIPLYIILSTCRRDFESLSWNPLRPVMGTGIIIITAYNPSSLFFHLREGYVELVLTEAAKPTRSRRLNQSILSDRWNWKMGPSLRPCPDVLEDDFRRECNPWAMRLTPDKACWDNDGGWRQNREEYVTRFCRGNAHKERRDNEYCLDASVSPPLCTGGVRNKAHCDENDGVKIPRSPSCSDVPPR